MIVVSKTSSSWDTITTQPTSTLSKAVVLTTINSIGSQVITPPLQVVTLWSTSTDGNGVLFTATAVVANPPQVPVMIQDGPLLRLDHHLRLVLPAELRHPQQPLLNSLVNEVSQVL